jgi:alpha-amylase/alpha-mannosidase (GH57 family)
MQRFVCIHGHFYQPPRENPWLEAIELQDSAYPYHDWNERIAAESYAPNAAARVLDGEGRIASIVNNYARISFDFGPTLLSWLEHGQRQTYEAVLAADRESRERFSGHGSALAQAYGHAILPLCNSRDKRTQVIWGLRDFEHRFGRAPEGMWLPETAVDLESLEILAEHGLRFTILAQTQAARVRPPGGEWHAFEGEDRIDPSLPYFLNLPSGRRIALFFYDGPIAKAVAYEKLLDNGEKLVERLRGAFSGDDRPRLVNIATDGETYGHHHRYGDMALSYALLRLDSGDGAKLTNYGEFLERFPPDHEVEIKENTAWSCAHGVGRWHTDCGCHTGGEEGWNQSWRQPLRDALDWLRDRMAPAFETAGGELFADAWAARDGYIDVLLDRSPENVSRFLARHAGRELRGEERMRALKLLEAQRHAMLMYTSCGWFFNELSGIETVQVLQYAGRALQLAEELFGDPLRAGFLDRLAAAKSNIAEMGDGRDVFHRFVEPAAVDLPRLAAHYAVTSLFEEFPQQASIYCFAVEREQYRTFAAGNARLALGRARFTSQITGDAARLAFGVLHFGDPNLTAGVGEPGEDEAFSAFMDEAGSTFERGDLAQVVRLLDAQFANSRHSLKSLFRDEQRRVLDLVLASTMEDVEGELRQLYGRHAPLMRFLHDLSVPIPRPLLTAAGFLLNRDLRRAFEDPSVDSEVVGKLFRETQAWGLEVDAPGLGLALGRSLERLAGSLRERPDDLALLERLLKLVGLVTSLKVPVNLWQTQNVYYGMLQTEYPARRQRAATDPEAARWVELFRELGAKLWVRVD